MKNRVRYETEMQLYPRTEIETNWLVGKSPGMVLPGLQKKILY